MVFVITVKNNYKENPTIYLDFRAKFQTARDYISYHSLQEKFAKKNLTNSCQKFLSRVSNLYQYFYLFENLERNF
jgi:hypothetical protein